MAVTKDDIVKYDDWNFKIRLDHKSLVEQVCDLTFSDEIITFRNGETKKATHWEVVFDKIYAPDVRKWIKGLR